MHFFLGKYVFLHLCTCAPGRLGALGAFLVVVGLQDVAVLGHHEDRDEVNHGESQELGLLAVLLKQTTPTKTTRAFSRLPPGC